MNHLTKCCMVLTGKSSLERLAILPVRRESRLNDKEQVIKRFQPSMDTKSAKVVTETIEMPPVHISASIRAKKIEEKAQKTKMRKLNYFDKRILVRLGKYKSIEDVPDVIKYKNVEVGQKEKQEIKSYLMEKGFRGVMFTDYFLTLSCLAILCIVFYLYKEAKNTDFKTEPKE